MRTSWRSLWRGAGVAVLMAVTAPAVAFAQSAGWVDPQVAALDALRAASDSPVRVEFQQDTGFPRALALDLPVGGAGAAAIARTFVTAYRDLFGLPTTDDLVVAGAWSDATQSVAVLAQRHHGVPVYGARLLVGLIGDPATGGARVRWTSGALAPALDFAIASTGTTATQAADTARLVLRRPGAPVLGIPQLAIFDPSILGQSGERRLIWRLVLDGAPAIEVLVDAHASQVVLDQPLGLDAQYGLWVMSAAGGAPCGIWSLASFPQVGDNFGVVPAFQSDANAVGVWSFAAEAAAGYGTAFGHWGLSGNGGLVLAWAHGSVPNAEYSSLCGDMHFRDGFVADDVAGHEYTHGVIHHSPSNIQYKWQSGALNESLADVLGVLLTDPTDWLMGESRIGVAPNSWIRNLANPPDKKCPIDDQNHYQPCPDRMSLRFNLPAMIDDGGVHIDSHIPSKAFYLMVKGGLFNNVSVAAMGEVKTRWLAYALARWIGPWPQFSDAREMAVNVATAWASVSALGYGPQDVCTVRNAFAAVELGSGDANCDGIENGPGDSDGDGIVDGKDNCPSKANPNQRDLNKNGIGDACELDTDGDLVPDWLDNCDAIPNPGQQNGDGDVLGDACDIDLDNDGIVNWNDNCPLHANSSQSDGNHNGRGDACDPDNDGDGFYVETDNCTFVANPSQSDADGDGLGDACDRCPTVADWNHAYTVPTLPGEDPAPLQPDEDGDGTPDACDAQPYGLASLAIDGSSPNSRSPIAPDGTTRALALSAPAGSAIRLPIVVCPPALPDGPPPGEGVELRFEGLPAAVEARVVDARGAIVAVALPAVQVPGGVALRGLRFQPDCSEPHWLELGFGATTGASVLLQSSLVALATSDPWGLESAAPLVPPPPFPDQDADGTPDFQDDCPTVPDPGQEDRGGLGIGSHSDGIGDACQCGDVNGDGRVTTADALVVQRALLVPPTATMARPGLCDVGGSLGCSTADALILRRALLVPPTATITRQCAPPAP